MGSCEKCNGTGYINDALSGTLICDCTFRKAGFGKMAQTDYPADEVSTPSCKVSKRRSPHMNETFLTLTLSSGKKITIRADQIAGYAEDPGVGVHLYLLYDDRWIPSVKETPAELGDMLEAAGCVCLSSLPKEELKEIYLQNKNSLTSAETPLSEVRIPVNVYGDCGNQ